MLTLNAEDFLRDNSITNNENELRIAIVDISRVDEIKKLLEAQGYSDIVPEDDEGNLYLTASRKDNAEDKTSEQPPEPKQIPQVQSQPALKLPAIKISTGVLISCESGKYKRPFFKKVLMSLVTSKIKPDVLGLMNGAVRLAAYNAPTCAYLKALESDGVKVLISESCADNMGITEALGVGESVDMSEIFEAIFSCEKVVSI